MKELLYLKFLYPLGKIQKVLATYVEDFLNSQKHGEFDFKMYKPIGHFHKKTLHVPLGQIYPKWCALGYEYQIYLLVTDLSVPVLLKYTNKTKQKSKLERFTKSFREV